MTQSNMEDLEEAALQTMVSRRCRRAYVHDIRGGLQAINSALELLARSLAAGGEKQPLMQKAAEFARRAVAAHEKGMDRLMDQLIPADEAPGPVNLRSLLLELLQFLQNDAASKEITFDFQADEELAVCVDGCKLRLVMLALITGGLDSLSPGSKLPIGLHRSNEDAVIVVEAQVAAPGTIEVVVAVAKRLAARQGGRVLHDASGAGPAISILLPLDRLDSAKVPAIPP